ncbi:hypothetical protein DENSPDRAFT_887321 [Dentipellis sp. KUC8613]|nr:hypothetical protein DENSPDRAFT_887321 [Dentipellis sp. KUC8613]
MDPCSPRRLARDPPPPFSRTLERRLARVRSPPLRRRPAFQRRPLTPFAPPAPCRHHDTSCHCRTASLAPSRSRLCAPSHTVALPQGDLAGCREPSLPSHAPLPCAVRHRQRPPVPPGVLSRAQAALSRAISRPARSAPPLLCRRRLGMPCSVIPRCRPVHSVSLWPPSPALPVIIRPRAPHQRRLALPPGAHAPP